MKYLAQHLTDSVFYVMVALGFALFPVTSSPTQFPVFLILASRALTALSTQVNGGQSYEGRLRGSKGASSWFLQVRL